MRFILTLIVLIIAVAAAQLYFPWWSMVIACYVVGGLSGMRGWASFVTGFLAVFLLWGAYAFYLSQGSVLPMKMANLLNNLDATFGENSTYVLILATALLGAILGGMATMTGSFGRNMFRSKTQNVEQVESA